MTTSLHVDLQLKSGELVLRYTIEAKRLDDRTQWYAFLRDREGQSLRGAPFTPEANGEPWLILTAALAALHILDEGIQIPGWRCAACKTFHATGKGHGEMTEGKAKVPRTVCRSCGAPKGVG